jgi:ornithine cyclodeaminase
MNALPLISEDQVRALLTYPVCIDLVRDAMIKLSAGETRQALRQIIPLEGGNAYGSMPGAIDGLCHGSKLISVMPGNPSKGLRSHEGVIMLFDPETGKATCAVDAGEVTAIRTAAASAVATDALARSDARTLGILGTGEQAWQHAAAMTHVRMIDEIRIWGRQQDAAAKLAKRVGAELNVHCLAASSVEEACQNADIICTTTSADRPILLVDHVAPGTHINAVGSSRAGPVEIDPRFVAQALFVPDHREGVIAQGAEFIEAKAHGLADESNLGPEIGEIVSGAKIGRKDDAQVTVYKSLGSIVQDIAAAHWLWQQCDENQKVIGQFRMA